MAFDLKKNIRANIAQLEAYSSARDEFEASSDALVFLDANENPFQNGVNRYPDPKQKTLKKCLSKRKNVSTRQILLGNGSDEVLDLIFRAFCEPKEDHVILMPPTYGMYEVLANLNDIEAKKVELDSKFDIDVENALKAINERSKIVFVCSPNNPTGNALSAERIEALLKACDGLVVIDEAYIDFSNRASWLERLNEFPNLIVCQTLSKAYGMAGIRLGICYASEAIIQVLDRIKPPYNVNELTQQKALERLSKPEEIEREIFSIQTARALLEKEMQKVSYISEIYPSSANFLLVKVDNAEKRYRQLIDHGIVVRNRSRQPLCKNTLRITVGTPEENQSLLEALLAIAT